MAPAATDTPERDVYTPSRLNHEARILLERGLPALWLTGEVSNFSRPSSGHWYFSLKDDSAQLRCAMFRQRNLMTQFAPKDGIHVLARGRVSLYEPRGDYQFIVDYLEEAGEGALRRRFEQLKAKLAAAGLFAAERKRALPSLPRRIGVITSPTGAAVRDILHILKRRFPMTAVLIYPVQVQGAQAAEQIAAAISLASARAECDALILARGGGSLEDLWAFNEEIVARALFECKIPTITGIGHETDFTIADFVADVRAPTPSGAAEVAVPDAREWISIFSGATERIVGLIERLLKDTLEQWNWLQRRLAQLHPGITLRERAQRVDELEQRMQRALVFRLAQFRAAFSERVAHLRRLSPAFRLAAAHARVERAQFALSTLVKQRLDIVKARYALTTRALNTVSPLATLQRGYAIVTNEEGAVITDASRVQNGETIHAQVSAGKITASVTSRELTKR